MRTCEEIAKYIDENHYYDKPNDFSRSISKIVETLQDDEEVIFAAGTRGISGETEVICQKFATVVITNQRLIYAGRPSALFSKNIYIRAVSLDCVSDIHCNEKSGGIAIDCRNEVVVFWTAKDKVIEVFNKVTAAIDNIKKANIQAVSGSNSAADEIKKFKELLDNNIITQEEFDAKKKQLLGL